MNIGIYLWLKVVSDRTPIHIHLHENGSLGMGGYDGMTFLHFVQTGCLLKSQSLLGVQSSTAFCVLQLLSI